MQKNAVLHIEIDALGEMPGGGGDILGGRCRGGGDAQLPIAQAQALQNGEHYSENGRKEQQNFGTAHTVRICALTITQPFGLL